MKNILFYSLALLVSGSMISAMNNGGLSGQISSSQLPTLPAGITPGLGKVSQAEPTQDEKNALEKAIMKGAEKPAESTAELEAVFAKSSNPKALANSILGYDAPPIRLAATQGNLDNVKILIRNNADVDAVSDGGFTPLMLAILQGQDEIAFYLIKAKANVNAKDQSGQSILDYVGFGNTTPETKEKLRKLLIENGAK